LKDYGGLYRKHGLTSLENILVGILLSRRKKCNGMNDLKITILKGTGKEFKYPANWICITFEELRDWIRRGIFLKHLFHYQEAGLLTYRIEFIVKPFLTSILLLLLSPRLCYFEDEQGNQQEITFYALGKLLWGIIRDFGRMFGLIRRTGIEVKYLSGFVSKQSKKKIFDLSGIPVYLRTDLAFGLRSGGSLGHIAGVLNHLDEFSKQCGKRIIVNRDDIRVSRGLTYPDAAVVKRQVEEVLNAKKNTSYKKKNNSHVVSVSYPNYGSTKTDGINKEVNNEIINQELGTT
jgi:hypothetical protein